MTVIELAILLSPENIYFEAINPSVRPNYCPFLHVAFSDITQTDLKNFY